MLTTLEIKQFCRWWCINEGVTHTFLLSLDCYLLYSSAIFSQSKSYNGRALALKREMHCKFFQNKEKETFSEN